MNSVQRHERYDYDCRTAMADLQLLLDGVPVSTPDSFEEHRRNCPDCRPRIKAAKLLLDAVACAARPTAPNGFSDRVTIAILTGQRANVRRQRLRAVGAMAALAAGVLVAVLAIRPGTERSELTLHDAIRAVVQLPEMKQPALPPLRDRLAEAGSAVVALTRRTADETLDRTLNLFPRSTEMKADFPTERLEPALQSLAEARTGAATSLEPIADTARRAFDLFRRELTPSSEPVVPKPSM